MFVAIPIVLLGIEDKLHVISHFSDGSYWLTKFQGLQYALFAFSGHNLNCVCLKHSQGLPVK